MELKAVEYAGLDINTISTFASKWFLLTAGDLDSGNFNTMTVSWGGLGMIWSKPVAWVPVRKSRHTHKFMEGNDCFSLCGLPEAHKEMLNVCGSKSGRDTDKIKETGLTPVQGCSMNAPVFAEADLIIECRKLYSTAVTIDQFASPEICQANYGDSDFHTIYIGEITAIRAADEYLA